MRIRGLAAPDHANPGDRGLPGFCPAVHPKLTAPGGSSRTSRFWKAGTLAANSRANEAIDVPAGIRTFWTVPPCQSPPNAQA